MAVSRICSIKGIQVGICMVMLTAQWVLAQPPAPLSKPRLVAGGNNASAKASDRRPPDAVVSPLKKDRQSTRSSKSSRLPTSSKGGGVPSSSGERLPTRAKDADAKSESDSNEPLGNPSFDAYPSEQQRLINRVLGADSSGIPKNVISMMSEWSHYEMGLDDSNSLQSRRLLRNQFLVDLKQKYIVGDPCFYDGALNTYSHPYHPLARLPSQQDHPHPELLAICLRFGFTIEDVIRAEPSNELSMSDDGDQPTVRARKDSAPFAKPSRSKGLGKNSPKRVDTAKKNNNGLNVATTTAAGDLESTVPVHERPVKPAQAPGAAPVQALADSSKLPYLSIKVPIVRDDQLGFEELTLEQIIAIGLDNNAAKARSKLLQYRDFLSRSPEILPKGEEVFRVAIAAREQRWRDAFLTFSEGNATDFNTAYQGLNKSRRRLTRYVMLSRRHMRRINLASGPMVLDDWPSKQELIRRLWDWESGAGNRRNASGLLAELRQFQNFDTMYDYDDRDLDHVSHAYSCSVNRLLGSLPANSAFVDIQRYKPVITAWLEGEDVAKVGEPRYIAFVFSVGATNGGKIDHSSSNKTAGDVPQFVLDGESRINRVDLGSAKEIDAALVQWLSDMRGGADGRQSGRQVAKLVWEPIRRAIIWQSRKPWKDTLPSLYVCADGPLALLPFGAIPVAKGDTVLLDQMRVATVPFAGYLVQWLNLRVSQMQYDRREPALDLLAVQAGDDLVSAQKEVQEIASQARGLRVRILENADAAPKRVLQELPNASYVHFATHALLPELALGDARRSGQLEVELNANECDAMMYAALLLNGERSTATLGDKVLPGGLISYVNCNNLRLATLAACNSGKGALTDGETMLGLVAAFHFAGAADVVGSLWKVDDEYTRRLMIEFYRRLWSEKRLPIDALREAQLAIYRNSDLGGESIDRTPIKEGGVLALKAKKRSDTANRTTPPRHWAGFFLSGVGGMRAPQADLDLWRIQ